MVITTRSYPFLARLALALGLLAGSFLVMAVTLAPRAGEPRLHFDAVAPELGMAAQAPLEAVAGVRAAGTSTTEPDVKTDEPVMGPLVIPGLAADGEVSTPPTAFLNFGDELAAAVAPYDGSTRYAIAVTDLQTGYTVGANLERQQLSGCVMNFFVILQALLDVEDGRYPLVTVDSLIRATTWSSNATTARELYRIVGDGDTTEGVHRVSGLHDVLGLDDVVIDHPPAYTSDSLGIDLNNWLTAEAVNSVLARVWRGEVLNDESRAYLLEVMADVKPGLNYLTAYVPGPATVSHKNGFFWSDVGYIDNDAGIVQVSGPDGDYAYIVTFLAEGTAYKYADLPLGQQLMRMAWDYFAETYAG